MSSKVIGFMASPRKKGNTSTLLDKVLEGVASRGGETEKIVLSDLNLKPCISCGGCNKTGLCVIKDDFQKLYTLLQENSCFVFASPYYFCGISAYGKSFIDRCQCIWVAKYRLRKPIAAKSSKRRGVFITSKGMPGFDGFEHIKAEVKAFYGVNNIAYYDEMLVDDCDGKGHVSHRIDVLERAFTCGQVLITG